MRPSLDAVLIARDIIEARSRSDHRTFERDHSVEESLTNFFRVYQDVDLTPKQEAQGKVDA